MVYIISDIHGNLQGLKDLLAYIQKDATQYVFLGDYIDKGPESKGVIAYLLRLNDEIPCVFLMGNHEFAWREYFNGETRFLDFLLKYGALETLREYVSPTLSLVSAREFLQKSRSLEMVFGEHASFFQKLLAYYRVNDEYICVHAGIMPTCMHLPIEEHSREKLCFVRDEFIHSRFLFEGKKIIFGHTCFAEPYIDDYKIGIHIANNQKCAGHSCVTALNLASLTCINQKGNVIDLKNKKELS